MARDRITPNQIMGGQSISMDGRNVQFGKYLQNAGYEYAPPVVSRRLMPIRNNTVDAAYITEEEGAGFVPAGIDNMVCEAFRQRRAAPQTERCLTTTKITFRQLWTKTVAKMIATGIFTGSTSNQLLAEPGHDEL